MNPEVENYLREQGIVNQNLVNNLIQNTNEERNIMQSLIRSLQEDKINVEPIIIDHK